MLIDVHAHFYTDRCGRADWQRLNARRLEAGRTIGISAHVASILGTWGARSPTYFPSPDDVTHANDAMMALSREHRGLVSGYCVVNPNYREHALAEIERGVAGGMIGIKLAASRRASDPMLDAVADAGAARGLPILQHVWQRRRREWPGQEASDASELTVLARRHPNTKFILAHLGGGGDWAHSLRVVQQVANIWVDLSGSGVDVDMLESAVRLLDRSRLVWGADVTLDTGWAKLRYLESLDLESGDLERIKWRNARGLFPAGAFDVVG